MIENRTELIVEIKRCVDHDIKQVYCKTETLCELGQRAAKRMYPDADLNFIHWDER